MKYELARHDVDNFRTAAEMTLAVLSHSPTEDQKRTARSLKKSIKTLNIQEQKHVESIVKKSK